MPYEIKDIVKIIKNKRDELNLSLRDLSSKTGISSSTLQRYETMETNMPIDKFQIICDVLGLEADKLLSNKNYSSQEKENNIFSQLTDEELAKLEKFNNMSTVMFMNEGNDISDKDKETLATAYAEVLISQRKKWCVMTSKFIIDTALKLRREYGNIYNLIKDKGIILKYVDLDSSIRGLSVDNVIFVNSNISNFEKEFVIAHEFGHYEFHDDSIRQFSKIEAFKGSREETQANLFATIFLQANYKDCDNDKKKKKNKNFFWEYY